MRNYFCGWYLRYQSDQQTLAVIPSVHRTKESKYCAIQLITDSQSFHVPFLYSEFQKQGKQICIAGNRFGKEGITLGIQTPELRANGSVRFGSSHQSGTTSWGRSDMFPSCSAGIVFLACGTR